MALADGFDERFQPFRVFGSPLLVADSDEFHVEGSRMPHLSPNLTPRGGNLPVGKLDQVKGILNIFLQVINVNMTGHVLVLKLARKTAAQNGERLGAHFLRQEKVFVKAKTIALIIIGIKTMGKGIMPAVFVKRTVFNRPHRIFPLVAGSQVRPFHNTSAGKAEDSRTDIRQGLGQVLPESVLMALPGIRRKQ